MANELLRSIELFCAEQQEWKRHDFHRFKAKRNFTEREKEKRVWKAPTKRDGMDHWRNKEKIDVKRKIFKKFWWNFLWMCVQWNAKSAICTWKPDPDIRWNCRRNWIKWISKIHNTQGNRKRKGPIPMYLYMLCVICQNASAQATWAQAPHAQTHMKIDWVEANIHNIVRGKLREQPATAEQKKKEANDWVNKARSREKSKQ